MVGTGVSHGRSAAAFSPENGSHNYVTLPQTTLIAVLGFPVERPATLSSYFIQKVDTTRVEVRFLLEWTRCRIPPHVFENTV